MKFKTVIFSLLSFLTLGACNVAQQQSEEPIKREFFFSKIDNDFYTSVRNRDQDTNTLTVSSYGGKPSIALKVGKEIFEHDLNLEVAEICLSACAEYLLPGAKKVTLLDQPLIGYHHSPLINDYLLKQNVKKNYNLCQKVGNLEQTQFLITTGKKPQAWQTTLEKLELVNYQVSYKENSCPWAAKQFKNEFWFPTSDQLNNIFGIKVTGDLCADSSECFKKKIPHHFSKGGTFIVGDTQYSFEPKAPIRK